ncbi:MAG: hypothetical protein KBG73_05780 [Candidatus Promineofilum sp.]|nr:hypothetical protein [Promineifilum sp.]
MDIINQRPGLAALVAFIAGLIIGLVVLGWGLFPVQYSGSDPSGLVPNYQAIFIRNAAEVYSWDNNQEKLRLALSGWGGDALACELAQTPVDAGDQARLVAAATIVNGQGCAGLAAAPDTTAPGVTAALPGQEAAADAGGSNLLPLLLFGLLLFLLLLAILYVWNRRRTLLEGGEAGETEYAQPAPVAKSAHSARPAMPGTTAAAAPATVALSAEPAAVPIARFRTAYTRGHDTYDDAFSIENANGDFLGECGVGISETIGATAPKNVTAFEVWLFDKNDIRTITKVIMSDHAFFDDALKAKLAPKGEPVLARENETIVLETASLIINAEITEMDYGAAAELPDASYFERFTIELSAWAKEGEGAATAKPGEGEDLLRY